MARKRRGYQGSHGKGNTSTSRAGAPSTKTMNPARVAQQLEQIKTLASTLVTGICFKKQHTLLCTPMFPLLKPKADMASAALTARLAKLEAQLAQHEMAAPVAPVAPECKADFEAEAWMASQIGSLPEAQQREVLLWTLQKKVGRMLGRLGAPGAARAALPRSPAKPPPPDNPVLPLEPRRTSSEPKRSYSSSEASDQRRR